MSKRRWFRVVVDGKGKAVDCRPVGDQGTAELGIFFVLAADAKEAARLAGNAHARDLLAARRARYESEGRCKCGRARDRAGLTTCSACLERHRIHAQRKRARERGEVVPPLDRRTVLLERKEQERGNVRFETLVEVQRAWLKLGAKGFERWLGGQLEAIAGRKAG